MERKPGDECVSRRRGSSRWWLGFALGVVWLSGCSDFWVDPTLNQIIVTDSSGITTPSVVQNATEQMQAIGVFSDGSRGPITAAWSSSDETIATIDSQSGMLTGVAPGTATITAANTGLTGTASVTVCGAAEQAITIQPQNQVVALGTGSLQYSATAGVDVTKTVTWASSNPGVAAISNSSGTNGKATLLSTGTTTISAKSCSFTASTTLTVN